MPELHKKIAEEYWMDRFSGELQNYELPFEKSMNSSSSGDINQMEFVISEELSYKLKKLSNNSDIALFILFYTCINIVLYKYTDCDDLILGTLSIDKYNDKHRLVLNRNKIDADKSLKDFINQIKETILLDFNHSKDVLYEVYQKISLSKINNTDIKTNSCAFIFNNIQKNLDNFDNWRVVISLAEEGADYYKLTIKYRENYSKESISFFYDSLKTLLANIYSNLSVNISELDITSVEQKTKILNDFNNTDVPYPKEKTIHELMEDQVNKTPLSTAIRYQNEDLVYQELNAKANQLARYLEERGVEKEDVIALMVNRSKEMIIGLYGILKSGCAYLPIDPNYPKERISYMLENSNAKIIITQGELEKNISNENTEIIKINEEKIFKKEDTNLKKTNIPTNIAYLIYTSGSTGKPKGIMVEHRNVVNFITGVTAIIPFESGETLLSLTTISFDIFILETFLPLSQGLKVVIGDHEDQSDPDKMAETVRINKVEMLQLTPSRLKTIMDSGKGEAIFSSVKKLMIGGEVFPINLFLELKKIFQGRIFNMYGPTETTVWSTIKDLTEQEDITLGEPIANTQIYILTKNNTIQPLEVPGELCIGGEGVARGYWKLDELTSEKFITNPFKEGGRIYKTGDLAKRTSSGALEFLGRLDYQVKIRGYRIELGEIESLINQHNKIKDSVVIAKEGKDKEKYLCAYIVCEKEFNTDILREYLSKSIPDYMVPAYYVKLKQLPLTPNGKIDRKSLPIPENPLGIGYVAPRNEIEKLLVLIYQEILGKENIGICDNFFKVGGDSIKLIQIASRINNNGYAIKIQDIYNNPTITQLATLVKKVTFAAEQNEVTGSFPLSPIQKNFFNNINIQPSHYNHAIMLYTKEELNKKMVKAILDKLIEHHDALRITFNFQNEILQINNPGFELPIEIYNLKGRENINSEIERIADNLEASIDLVKGPLIKAAIFNSDQESQLLIIIHHLVVDGISWRILFEDIDTLFHLYTQNKPLTLPPKKTSFKAWVEKLYEYSNSEELMRDKIFWKRMIESSVQPLERDFKDGSNYNSERVASNFTLEESYSSKILNKANDAFGTTINDLLICALGLAINSVFGNSKIMLDIESHGRENLFKDIDINRTVGWFTSIYPVTIDLKFKTDIASQIKDVKEILHTIPKKGIGYFILKYITPLENKRDLYFGTGSNIVFNYLGQFDADINRRSFRISNELTGTKISLKQKALYDLEINGIFVNNKLNISVIYSKGQYKQATIEKFLECFKSTLTNIIEFCSNREQRELTPSDFYFNNLSIEDCDKLTKKYELEDIYPLSPMQEGMLAQYLQNENSSTHVCQLSFRIQGKLNTDSIKVIVNKIIASHETLRAIFIYERLERPIQLIIKNRVFDPSIIDITHLPNNSTKENYIRDYKEKERTNPFNLSKDLLIRLSVIKINDYEYELVWNYHHIIMDGWCNAIIISEFLKLYYSFLSGKNYELALSESYKLYLEWLKNQNFVLAKNYWKNYLETYNNSVGISVIGNYSPYYNNNEERDEIHFQITHELFEKLVKLSQELKITLNTIVEIVWAVILGRYNNKSDVLFGSVVSGRPADIKNIENIVGIFINTIPLRINFNKEMEFIQLANKVQGETIMQQQFQYLSINEIRSLFPKNKIAFDHDLVFENLPQIHNVNRRDEIDSSSKIQIINVDAFIHSIYDFGIIFSPNNNLSFRINYKSTKYEKDVIDKIGVHIIEVLKQIAINPFIKILDINLSYELELLNGNSLKKDVGDFQF